MTTKPKFVVQRRAVNSDSPWQDWDAKPTEAKARTVVEAREYIDTDDGRKPKLYEYQVVMRRPGMADVVVEKKVKPSLASEEGDPD